MFYPLDHDLFLEGNDDTVLNDWITTIKPDVMQQPALKKLSFVAYALSQVPNIKSTFRTLFLAVTMLDVDFIFNMSPSEVMTSYDNQLLNVFDEVGFDESFIQEA